MMILYKVVDFMKVIRIKIIAFYAEMSLNRFGKALRFVSISLSDFVRMAQSRSPFGLRKLSILRQDSSGLASGLIELQNFSQLTSDSILSSSLTCFCN